MSDEPGIVGTRSAPPLDAVAAPGRASLVKAGGSQLPSPPTTPFDENQVRKNISFWLLWLLTGILCAAFVALGAVFFTDDVTSGKRFDHLIALLQIVFGPMIALVSSVIGFYFGARTVSDSKAR